MKWSEFSYCRKSDGAVVVENCFKIVFCLEAHFFGSFFLKKKNNNIKNIRNYFIFMKHNFRKEVNLIRRKSFPEIKGVIWIIKIPFFIPGAAAIWLLPNLNLLAFSTKCKILPKNVLRGLIAHELSIFLFFKGVAGKDFGSFSLQ